MLPTLPETVVILVICVAIFGLGKLDRLGEAVWRLRCRLNPDLEEADDGRTEDSSTANHDAT
jgi:hypothetical protein